MSKSAICTTNTSIQDVAVNGIINLGTVVRRFGPNINLSGDAIQISGPGYYDVSASITATPTAAGNVTVTLFKDGVAVSGATATQAAAAEDTPVNLSISALLREFCSCCESISNLTLVLSGTASEVSNISVIVRKL